MAEDNRTEFKLDLDSEDFKKQLDDVNQKLDSIHGDTHTTGVATMFTAFAEGAELAKEAIHKLGEVAEWVFDQILDAEKVKAINYQFEQLSKNAGLSGEELKEGFEKAAGGMTPTVEILKVANVALLNLGDGARRMPELFEVARKSAALMGGTAIEKFESLAKAVEFGNKRLLRQAGIAIDVEAAQRKYAESIGVTTEQLDENLKKQAILNEVLEFSKNRMVSAPADIRPVTLEWAKLKTAVVEMSEALGVLFNKAYGIYFKGIINGLSDVATSVKTFLVDKFGDGADQARAHMERVRNSVFSVKEQIEALNKNPESSIPFTSANARLKDLTAQLGKLREELIKAQNAAKEKGGEAPEKSGVSDLEKSKAKARAEFHAKQLEDKTKADKEYADLQLSLDKAIAREEEKTQTGSVAAHKSAKLREKVIDEEYEADKKKIAALGLAAGAQKNALEIAAFNKRNAAYVASEKKMNADIKKDDEATQHFKTVSQNAFSSNYMQSIKDLVSGQKDASEAIKGFFLGALGDMAMKQGEFMVLDAFKTFPFINFPEMAAGGGLIALGGALGGMAGGSAGSMASSAGGGYASSIGNQNETINQPGSSSNSDSLTQNAAPRSSVTIAVAGNYFETEETKRRLAEIIREHQDATDFTFKQIGQA